MNKLSFLNYLVIFLLLFSSCNYLADRLFLSRPDNKEFEYYTKEDSPKISSILHTTSFYYGDNDTRSYLSFKSDGLVVLFDHTAMVPDTVNAFSGIMDPERKRSKRPKSLHVDFGYFVTESDSLFFTVLQKGVLGSEKWYKYKGVVKKDSLILNRSGFNIETSDYEEFDSAMVYLFYRSTNGN